MGFSGIPAEAFDFYDALAADNTKTFWTEHKGDYERYVRDPLRTLATELEPAFGPAHLYRPYRDVRFSKDKTPYKDHQGMFMELRNGLGWYLQLSSAGLMVAAGWYQSDSEQVQRYRERVASDDGDRLEAMLDDLQSAGYEVGGNQLKTRPRGVDADHPHLELLRYRSLYVTRTWQPAAWMGTREAVDRVGGAWEQARSFTDWLAGVVGPGDAPVGSRGRRTGS